jgi:hypothetical protein
VFTELRQIATHVRSALVRLAKGGWCFSNRVDVRVGDEKRSMSSAGDTHGLQCPVLEVGKRQREVLAAPLELARVAVSQKLKQSMQSLKLFAKF